MPGLAGVCGSEKRRTLEGGVGRGELSAKDLQKTAGVSRAPKAEGLLS